MVRDSAMPYLLDVWLFEEKEEECFVPDLGCGRDKRGE